MAKLKIICTEPDNAKREGVTEELIVSISSDSFMDILMAIFESGSDPYDPGRVY